MKSVFTIVIILFTSLNFCGTKDGETSSRTNLNEDVLILRKLHDDYIQKRSQHNDGGNALFTFEEKLKEILENSHYINNDLYKALSENDFFLVKSEDDKLIFIYWEIIDYGCHHSYKSLYRYSDEDSLFVDYFAGKANIEFSEDNGAHPYKVHKLNDSTYLTFNTQLVCSSSRLLSSKVICFNNESKGICLDCFENSDGLYTSVGRRDTLNLKFDTVTKELFYPELTPLIHEGEDTGILKTTGKYKKLVYREGKFIKN
ncbi:hypothetical protein [Algibacter lectus]|uniref:Uncharacterized protein n=1 Tax=Algibacter lectus TaxID=221126 RepID=A0A090VJU5_9FLAO|nr:hypothetical protein [Algibacter lectus]GAL64990.1 hypothetical protein JCM19300_2219 [Algibacter lectus]